MTSNNPNAGEKGEGAAADAVDAGRTIVGIGPQPADSVSRDKDSEHHFRTEHLLTNFRRRTISSAFVTITSQGAKFVLNMASTMILARLLTAADFGIVAMVTTVIGFLSAFTETGLGTPTLQREGLTHAQASNLFWINVGVSCLLALILAAASPAIAWFYHEPRLVGVTLALSLSCISSGLVIQHIALLSRQMRFKARALIEIVSLLGGMVMGISLAWLGYGYWSLVGATLTTALTCQVMTWSISPWRPQFFTRGSGTRSLLSFGANLSAGNFVYSLARGTDGLLIGRFFGSDALGLYSRAYFLLMRPLEQFLRPVDMVLETTLSRLQTQPERYRRTFLRVYESIALATFLFTGLVLALAHPLILVALGAKWEKADVIFGGFTMAALSYPLLKAADWLFTTQGRGRESLKARFLQAGLCLLAFLMGLPYGPAGIAIAFSVSCLFIQLPILNHLAGRRGPVSTADLWKGFFRHVPICIVVFLVARMTCSGMSRSAPILQVAVSSSLGLLAGLAFIWIFPPTRRTALGLFEALQEFRGSPRK